MRERDKITRAWNKYLSDVIGIHSFMWAARHWEKKATQEEKKIISKLAK